MRTRDKSINIRITNSEKKRIERNARKCRLSVSTYLRLIGLNPKIAPAPSEKLFEAYKLFNKFSSEITRIDPASYYLYFDEIKSKLLEAASLSYGEPDGYNEDMEH